MNDLYLADAADSQNMDYDSVDITDSYMFSYIMRNPEICRKTLQCLFPDHHVIGVKYKPLETHGGEEEKAQEPASQTVETEKSIVGAFGTHGVRLDVFMDAGDTVYNIEMQTTSQTALNKRARYYQAEVDVNQLPRGGAYDNLKPSYVIFICKFDPYERGQYVYTFRNYCKEEPLELEDGSYILFVSTKGEKGNISKELKELLKYMDNTKEFPVSETDNELIKEIDHAVIEARADSEWRVAYMTYQVHQRAALLEGREQGIAIGRERAIDQVIINMHDAGCSDDMIVNVTGKSKEHVQLVIAAHSAKAKN